MLPTLAPSLLLLLTVVSALPQPDLEKRADPAKEDVTFEQMTSSSATCGGTTFSADDIYKAAQWGVLLAEDGQARGKKSNEYPNGRFPHAFTQNRNNQTLSFLPGCPDGDDTRIEYPLVVNGPYNGGISNNVKWGPHRVVYMHEEGEVDEDGKPKGKYCGVMTHTGASDGQSFVLCS